MGRLRGNTHALFVLFFVSAVFLTGSLYSTAGTVLEGHSLALAIVAAEAFALAFALLVLGRILWVATGSVIRDRVAASYQGEESGPSPPMS